MASLKGVFPCFSLSCKANARVKPRKDGARPALFLVVVLLYEFFVMFYVFFVLLYVFLCSTYCLFCGVPSIVFVYMCTEQLPPGGYTIAVKYIISFRKERKYLFLFQRMNRTSVIILYNDQQTHNYFTNYHTATCF
jgi:hypothetical protein